MSAARGAVMNASVLHATRAGATPGAEPEPAEPATASQRYHKARTVDELTEHNVRAIHRLEAVARRERGWLDRVANAVSSFCSSGGFLIGHVLAFAAWIGFNVWPGTPHYDPYPFTFLTLVVSLEAIFLSAFILISQKQAARIDDRRNQLDLQINLLTEQENTKMLKLLQAVAQKLGIEDDGDPSLQVLEQATRPDKLAQQIDRVAERRRTRARA